MKPRSPLPELPVWHARSFYAMLLTVTTIGCNAIGFDFLAFADELGLENEPEILDTVETLAPYIFALWAWLERRAPRYQLVWKRLKNTFAGI